MRSTTIKIELDESNNISYIFRVRTLQASFTSLSQEELSHFNTNHYYISKSGGLTVVSFSEKHPMFNIGILDKQFIFTKYYSYVKLAVHEFLKSIKYI